MKVTGFTFIRNALQYDYPIEEAIRSILPICDAFVVAVGQSEDATLKLIQSIDNQKISIIKTVWNDTLREGGQVLAEETNKAFKAISKDTDWAFYIQGDEVVHEKYLSTIRAAMEVHLEDKKVEGLLFNYRHFYGSYDYVGSSMSWYRREVRIVRNLSNIYSYKDAQGFRIDANRKLAVQLIPAEIYHYGWVKPPEIMQQKQENFNKYWHDDDWVKQNIAKTPAFDYQKITALERFAGTHPQVMEARIARKNWQFEHDISFNKYSWKERIKQKVEAWTGWRMGEYQNYKLLK